MKHSTMKECPICGKTFCNMMSHQMWIYKVVSDHKTIHLCSFTCYEKAKKLVAENKKLL